MGRQLTKDEVIEALQASRGMVTVAASKLNCTPATIHNWLKKSPDCRAVLAQERERVIDTAELGLMKALNQSEAWAIAFTLKTIGKGRGYTERVENVNLDLTPELTAKLKDVAKALGVSAGDLLEAYVQELASVNQSAENTAGGE